MGHRVLGGQQLITWPWQVIPPLWACFSAYIRAHLPITQGTSSRVLLHTFSIRTIVPDSLPGSCEQKGSKSPGAGAGTCPAHAGRIEGALPVSGNTHLPYPCQSRHPFSLRWLPRAYLMSPPPGSSLSLILSLVDPTRSAVLWQGPPPKGTYILPGASGNTGPAGGDLRIPGALSERDILFSRWPATCSTSTDRSLRGRRVASSASDLPGTLASLQISAKGLKKK